jgi:photosystem II stability/assembly factor-like uncharacterized protein
VASKRNLPTHTLKAIKKYKTIITMKFFFIITLFLISFVSFSQSDTLLFKREDLSSRIQFETNSVIDKKTGKIPVEDLRQARLKANYKNLQSTNAAIPNVNWYERGPSNIGGRVRPIVFDPNDPLKKKVWAGGASGGLWYNNDITDANSSWNKVNDLWQNLLVNSIAFDPSNSQIIYATTGEYEIGIYSYYSEIGGGIYKSTDGGQSWILLNSTIPNDNSGTIGYSMQYIKKIIINNLGHLFIGTKDGLLKSTDGGLTWTRPNLVSATTYDIEIANTGIIYCAVRGGIGAGNLFKSHDNGNTWINISPDIESEYSERRIEIGLSNATNENNQFIYVIYASFNERLLKKSINGGKEWTTIESPRYEDGENFTSVQAYYNLAIAIHPQNPNHIFFAGTNLARSIDGGLTWNFPPYYWRNHPDYHNIVFRPSNFNQILVATDGGIYFSENSGDSNHTNPSFEARNKGLNITQFYSVAIRNIAGDGYVIAGAQDNFTQRLNGNYKSVSESESINGGDGTLCFIDQDEPEIKISSSQGGRFFIESPESQYFLNVIAGDFIHHADYDSQSNTFYTRYNEDYTNSQTVFAKLKITGNTFNLSYFNAPQAFYTKIKVGKAPNTVFLIASDWSCFIRKITNLDLPTPTSTCIATGNQMPISDISNIDIGTDDNELLVTSSSYSSYTKSIYYTNNGGQTWISKDENNYGFPNIPIRDGLFNPQNTSQVLLATELGVWSTNDIKASNPAWQQSNNQLANVRCNMLKYRASDGIVAVATYGRGIFFTDVFQKPNLKWISIQIAPWRNIEVYKGFCKGVTQPLEFNNSGNFNSGNIFSVELSDNNGNFSNPTIIGTGTTSPIQVTFPTNIADGHGFRLRVVSSNPNIISNLSGKFALFSSGLVYLNQPTLCFGGRGSIVASITPINAKGTFSWVGPNGFSSNQRDLEFINSNSNHAGIYTLTSNFNGVCSNQSSYSINVTVSNPPTISLTNTGPYTDGQTIRLDVVGANNTKYYTLPHPFNDRISSSNSFVTLSTSYYSTHIGGKFKVFGRLNSTGCWGIASSNVIVNSNCGDNKVIDKSIYNKTTISATQTITSNKWILDGANANFNSGQKIEFTPGFEVKKGGVFQAQVGGCNN